MWITDNSMRLAVRSRLAVTIAAGGLAIAALAYLHRKRATSRQRTAEMTVEALLVESKELIKARDGAAAVKKLTACRQVLEEVKDAPSSRSLSMKLHLRLGEAYNARGDHKTAIAQFSTALEFSRESGSSDDKLSCLIPLGATCCDNLGDIDSALEHFEEALAISREAGSSRGQCFALSNIGAAHGKRGELALAVEYKLAAIDAVRAQNDRSMEVGSERITQNMEASLLGATAHLYDRLGQLENAVEYRRHACAVHRKLGDARGANWALRQLAFISSRLGTQWLSTQQYGKAIEEFRASLAAFGELRIHLGESQTPGDIEGEAKALLDIASCYYQSGQYAETIRFAEAALDIKRACGPRHERRDSEADPQELLDLKEVMFLEMIIGKTHQTFGHFDKAMEHKVNMLVISREFGEREIGDAMLELSATCLEMRARWASNYATQAIAIARKLGDWGTEASALGYLGQAHRQLCHSSGALEHLARAIEYTEAALAIFREHNARESVCTTLSYLASLHSALGHHSTAIEHYEAALDVHREAGDPDSVIEHKMGLEYYKMGRFLVAIE